LRRFVGARVIFGLNEEMFSRVTEIAIAENAAVEATALAHRIVGAAANEVAAIALANKIARMAWAMMAKNERYKEPVALAA
jgi:hypothetical protein